MSAEARNLSEELFKLVDTDNSGKISKAEFAAACGTIAQVSPELLPEDFAKLDENRDGEVDRPEWSRRRGTRTDAAAARAIARWERCQGAIGSARRERDASGPPSRAQGSSSAPTRAAEA